MHDGLVGVDISIDTFVSAVQNPASIVYTRNIHDFDEWVESDLKYIRERSLWVDLKVILKTIKVVLTGEGAM